LSDGKLHDVNFLDEMPLEPGAYYVMDRGYVDFRRLHRFVTEGAFFVTRAKSNFRYRTVLANPPDLDHGVRTDQVVVLTSAASAKAYPDRLRRIRFYDAEQARYLTFLTNNIILSASMIAQLYKCRWKIELFFKWIKQNLKIKVFYGYSNNAVRTQIWIAVCAYTLVAIVKKELKLEISLSQMLQLISVSVFEKVPLPELFIEHVTIPDCAKTPTTISNQLLLNGI
jgi:IS4 transposase